MMIEMTSLTAVVVAAIVVYAARIMGPTLMLAVPLTPKIVRFLDMLSLSVIVAIIASALAKSTMREAAAVVVAAVVMIAARNAILAMAGGIAIAALWLRV